MTISAANGLFPVLRSPQAPTAVTVGLAFVAMSVALLGFVWTAHFGFLLVALATCPLVILLAPQLWQRSFDLFAPLNFVALSALFGVTLRSVYIALVNDRTTREVLLLDRPLEILLPAVLLINGALVSLVLGYLVPWPRVPLHRVPLIGGAGWSESRVDVVAAVLVAVGLACTALYMDRLDIEIGQLAQLSAKRRLEVPDATYGYAAMGYHLWGMSLFSFAFYLLVTRLALSRRSLISLEGIVTLGAALLAAFPPFLTSSRTGVLLLLVHAAIIWNHGRRPLTGRWIAGAVVAALLVFTVMAGLRVMGRAPERSGADFDLALLTRAVLANRNWLDITKTAHLMEAFPEDIEHLRGTSFVTWAIAPIPRTVWPDKPIVRIGDVLGPVVFEKEHVRSGVPPGFVGELYINFGYFGVIAGMFALGAVLRLLYVGFWPFLATDGSALLVYTISVVLLSFSLVANDFGGMMIGIARSLITLAIVLFLVRRPDSRTISDPALVGPGQATSAGRP